MKLIATKGIRIRVDGIKQDLEKWAIVDVPERDINYFVNNGFILLDENVKQATLIGNDPALAEKVMETTEIKDEQDVEVKKKAQAKKAKEEVKEEVEGAE